MLLNVAGAGLNKALNFNHLPDFYQGTLLSRDLSVCVCVCVCMCVRSLYLSV